MVLAPILCFFLFTGVWCLNEVAKELENPYGADDNDISLPDFHGRFVESILDVANLSAERQKQELAERQKQELPASKEVLNGGEHVQAAATPALVAEKAPAQELPPTATKPSGEPGLALTPPVSSSPKPKAAHPRYTEELELQLIQISARMEQHLARISCELPLVSMALSELSSSHAGSHTNGQGQQNGADQSGNLPGLQHACGDLDGMVPEEITSISDCMRQGKWHQI